MSPINNNNVSNSDGKCLLANFVEERAVEHLDTMKDAPPHVGKGRYFQNGHYGIITKDCMEPLSNTTCVRDAYIEHQPLSERLIGKRKELKGKYLTWKVEKTLREAAEPPPKPKIDYVTTTGRTYNIDGFVSQEIPPTRPHDYATEQGVSYWSEHKDKVAGMTQIKTGDTPFRRNAAFSQPIEESWDAPKPYEMPQYPNM